MAAVTFKDGCLELTATYKNFLCCVHAHTDLLSVLQREIVSQFEKNFGCIFSFFRDLLDLPESLAFQETKDLR